MTALRATWHCLTPDCPESGSGTPAEVDKAAERHVKREGHSTITSALRAVEDA